MVDALVLVILPYTAVSFSIIARLIFMYLLYTKKVQIFIHYASVI
jgi:hypothetical protein